MKNKIYLLAAIILAGFSFGCQPESDELNPEITDALSKRAPSQFQTDKYIVITHDETLPAGLAKKIEDAGGVINSEMSEVGVIAVTATNKQFTKQVSRMQEVRYVIPDLELQWRQPGIQVDFEKDLANPPFAELGEIDPFYNFQWGLDAIDAPDAWQSGYKGAGVKVAVLDEGFWLEHPDLEPNIIGAISSVPGESPQFEPYVNELGTLVYFSHGTHVAGTIAAPINDLGVVGVAPEAKLLLVKVLSEKTGSGEFSWIINGIYLSALYGVDVINMSLGASIPQGMGIGSNQVAALRVAVDRAVNFAHKSGAVVITSAGNSARNANKDGSVVVFPASSPKAIAISATAPEGWIYNFSTNLDVIASYSNFGSSLIDFAAPGGDFDFPDPLFFYDMVLSTSLIDPSGIAGYSFSAGTSMAAPHAAGVAALIIGKYQGNIDPAKVEDILRKSADDLGKPGKDDYYGYGRMNAYKAIME